MIKRTNQNLQETFCACVESAIAARYIKDDQVSVPCANHSEDAFCACRCRILGHQEIIKYRGKKFTIEISHRWGRQNARMSSKLVEHIHEVDFMLLHIF